MGEGDWRGWSGLVSFIMCKIALVDVLSVSLCRLRYIAQQSAAKHTILPWYLLFKYETGSVKFVSFFEIKSLFLHVEREIVCSPFPSVRQIAYSYRSPAKTRTLFLCFFFYLFQNVHQPNLRIRVSFEWNYTASIATHNICTYMYSYMYRERPAHTYSRLASGLSTLSMWYPMIFKCRNTCT